jgi:phytoene desaturase
MTRTTVVGGGVAGLATAALLAHEGHQVRLLERSTRLGGRAGVLDIDGFRFDTGPSWYLMPRVFEHFFSLLGTTADAQLDLRDLDPGYRVFTESSDEPVVVPRGADRAAALFESVEPGAGHALRRYLGSARHAARLAEEYFLYNPFTDPRSLLTRPVLAEAAGLIPLLTGPLSRFAGRRFSDRTLRQILEYPAVFLGTDPRRAPALYHLMSALDLDDGVRYPMGGFAEVVERLTALAVDAGVDLVTGAEVTEILTRREGARFAAEGVRWRAADGSEHIQHANVVVSAADLHHTETALLAPEAQSYPEGWWRKRQSGPGAAIALLGVRGSLPRLAHHSLFFTDDWNAGFDVVFGHRPTTPDPASFYVCRPSATDPHVAPAGHENLFVLIPVPAEPALGSGGSDGHGSPAIEAAVDAAIDRIARQAHAPDLRDRIVVRRTIGPADFVHDYNSWHGGMLGPSHILSQSALFRPQNRSKRVDGLYYAGGTTAPGVGVPMCLISAELVLKHIRGDSSAGPTAPVPRAASAASSR